jgi:hypothetical protein
MLASRIQNRQGAGTLQLRGVFDTLRWLAGYWREEIQYAWLLIWLHPHHLDATLEIVGVVLMLGALKIIGAVSTVASEVVRALTCSLTSCDATESLGAASLIHASEWQHFRFRIRAIQHIAIFDSSDPISCNNGTRSFDGPARSALGVVRRGQICLPVSRLISTCSTVRGSYIRSRKPVRLS